MQYSTSFKKPIIDQCQNGASVFSISKENGVSRSTIYRWLLEASTVETTEKIYSLSDIKALKRKVEKQAKIISILKTVPCTVHSPLKERLNALEALHSEYDVHTLCEALNVARGTYYNHILRNKRDNVWYKKREEEYRILAKYIDFYNNKRPHSTMNHKTPAQVEQAYYEKHSVSRQGSD